MSLSAGLAETEHEYTRIKVTPLAGALGAEISGVNLAKLEDASFELIHSAWID